MFVLAHLGIGLGLAWLLAGTSRGRIDYRLILLGAILPDLIDKPLGAALGLDTRIWGHTFLFLFAVLALSLVPTMQALRLVGFGVATHLLLDGIWVQPAVALYPVDGWWFPPTEFHPEGWIDVLLHNPLVQFGEIIGALILLAFAWRHGLFSRKALSAFLGHGVLTHSAEGQP
jgi:inner membrane protein